MSNKAKSKKPGKPSATPGFKVETIGSVNVSLSSPGRREHFKSTSAPRKSDKESAAALRAKFPKDKFTALRMPFTPPTLITGNTYAITEKDPKVLMAQLGRCESRWSSLMSDYADLYNKGLEALEDWEVTQSRDLEATLRGELEAGEKAVRTARSERDSLKARLTELQGGLVPIIATPPKLPALPNPNKKDDKPQKVGEMQYLSVPIERIEALLLASAKDDVRYYLNGIYLHQHEKELRMVATNGHTLLAISSELDDLPDWLKAGVILPREELTIAIAAIGKKRKDVSVSVLQVGYGVNQQHLVLRDHGQFATFKCQPIDGKFPDYGSVLEKAAGVLNGGEALPLSATSVDALYLRQASAIAGKLETGKAPLGVTPFVSHDENSPTVFTFGSTPGALFVVMGMRATIEQQVPIKAISMMSSGLAGTAAALKAHLTRQKNAMAATTDEALKKVAATAIASLEARLALVGQAMGAKALEGPKPKKAGKVPSAAVIAPGSELKQ